MVIGAGDAAADDGRGRDEGGRQAGHQGQQRRTDDCPPHPAS